METIMVAKTQKKTITIKKIRTKKQTIEHVNPLHKPLSYWQEKYPDWTGLEPLIDPKYQSSVVFPEGDDWKGPGWDRMWDVFIELVIPHILDILKEEAERAS